jgi:hypothetical protein
MALSHIPTKPQGKFIFFRLHMKTFAMEQSTGKMSVTEGASGIFLKYSAPRQSLQETISGLMYRKRCPCV